MRYNPKTGEFENDGDLKPAAPPKPRYSSPPANTTSDNDSGCLGTILGIIFIVLLNSIPYLIIAGLASLCS